MLIGRVSRLASTDRINKSRRIYQNAQSDWARYRLLFPSLNGRQCIDNNGMKGGNKKEKDVGRNSDGAACKRNLITCVDKLDSLERQKRLVLKMPNHADPTILLTVCVCISIE